VVRSIAAALTPALEHLRIDIRQILQAAVDAVLPARLFASSDVRDRLDKLGEAPVTLIAAGKAARPMARAFARRFRGTVTRALVAGPPAGPAPLPADWQTLSPAHPFADEASLEAGARALELARDACEANLVVLLSGGASSMLCVPSAGLTIGDKNETARLLMNAGTSIDALNCVRKHLSAIKGGRLGAAAGPSLTLAISDVHHPVEDDASVIGSGPTVSDATTFAGALEVVTGIRGIPTAVRRHLERGAAGLLAETVKPDDPRLARAAFHVIGNRRTALAGAAGCARERGYHVIVLDEAIGGEARTASRHFIESARSAAPASRPACVLAAGETTVSLTGRGRGGRNQEFVLAAINRLDAFESLTVLASAGTDGLDGPTDAAGALADSETARRAANLRLDPAAALANNDAYPFFDALGDLIFSGPTGTNVGDVQILLVA
jgi:glycerate 2-kinase